MEVVKVKHTDVEGNKYKLINKSDFVEGEHEIYDDPDDKKSAPAPTEGMSEKEREAYDAKMAQKTVDSRSGIEGGGATLASAGNTSGTFSEPTPSDIRYPDKDATEFENNHGAFVNKSAAGMRETMGLEHKPGGLYPEVHEDVQAKTAALAAPAPSAKKKTTDEAGEGLSSAELEAMTVAELKEHAEKNQIDLGDATLKADIIKAIKKHQKAKTKAE